MRTIYCNGRYPRWACKRLPIERRGWRFCKNMRAGDFSPALNDLSGIILFSLAAVCGKRRGFGSFPPVYARRVAVFKTRKISVIFFFRYSRNFIFLLAHKNSRLLFYYYEPSFRLLYGLKRRRRLNSFYRPRRCGKGAKKRLTPIYVPFIAKKVKNLCKK